MSERRFEGLASPPGDVDANLFFRTTRVVHPCSTDSSSPGRRKDLPIPGAEARHAGPRERGALGWALTDKEVASLDAGRNVLV
jgi:hypothetical protein